jgi:hypothetical protein
VEKSVKRKIAGRSQAPACLRKKQFQSIFLKALDNVFIYIKNKNKITFKFLKISPEVIMYVRRIT